MQGLLNIITLPPELGELLSPWSGSDVLAAVATCRTTVQNLAVLALFRLAHLVNVSSSQHIMAWLLGDPHVFTWVVSCLSLDTNRLFAPFGFAKDNIARCPMAGYLPWVGSAVYAMKLGCIRRVPTGLGVCHVDNYTNFHIPCWLNDAQNRFCIEGGLVKSVQCRLHRCQGTAMAFAYRTRLVHLMTESVC